MKAARNREYKLLRSLRKKRKLTQAQYDELIKKMREFFSPKKPKQQGETNGTGNT
jgi:hypothetical protein